MVSYVIKIRKEKGRRERERERENRLHLAYPDFLTSVSSLPAPVCKLWAVIRVFFHYSSKTCTVWVQSQQLTSLPRKKGGGFKKIWKSENRKSQNPLPCIRAFLKPPWTFSWTFFFRKSSDQVQILNFFDFSISPLKFDLWTLFSGKKSLNPWTFGPKFIGAETSFFNFFFSTSSVLVHQYFINFQLFFWLKIFKDFRFSFS